MGQTRRRFAHHGPCQLPSEPLELKSVSRRLGLQEQTFGVEEGDILVAASDGLYDNVFESELLEILQLSDDETAASDLGASSTGATPAGASCKCQQVMGDRWGR